MDQLHVLELIDPAGHSGLVGHHGDGDACGVEPRDGLDRAVDELDVLDSSDVAVIDVDGAVTVQQNVAELMG